MTTNGSMTILGEPRAGRAERIDGAGADVLARGAKAEKAPEACAPEPSALSVGVEARKP